MKKFITVTAVVAMLAMTAVACGGGGSVTIPSIAAVDTEPASLETYCALEARARVALEPFLGDRANPIAARATLAEAATLASQVAVVAPSDIAVDVSRRRAVVSGLRRVVEADRYDVGSLSPRHPALIMRSSTFIDTLDRIGAYDLRECGL